MAETNAWEDAPDVNVSSENTVAPSASEAPPTENVPDVNQWADAPDVNTSTPSTGASSYSWSEAPDVNAGAPATVYGPERPANMPAAPTPYEPGELGYAANQIQERWNEVERDTRKTNARIDTLRNSGDWLGASREYAGLQARNAGRVAMGGLNALQLAGGSVSQVLGTADELSRRNAEDVWQETYKATGSRQAADAAYLGSGLARTWGSGLGGSIIQAGAELGRTAGQAIQGAANPLDAVGRGLQAVGQEASQAWDSERARDFGSGKVVSTMYDMSREPIDIGGVKIANLPVNALDFGASLVLDPTMYLGGMGLGEAALKGLRVAPEVIAGTSAAGTLAKNVAESVVPRGASTLAERAGVALNAADNAFSAPYRGLEALAGDPKLAGYAGGAGMAALGIASVAEGVTDQAGNPLLGSPLGAITSKLPEEYRDATGLLITGGLALGIAGGGRLANKAIGKFAARTSMEAVGNEIVRKVGTDLVKTEGLRVDTATGNIVDKAGNVVRDARVAQPGETIQRTTDLRQMTQYSEGNAALNDVAMTNELFARNFLDAPDKYASGITGLVDAVVSDPTVIRRPQELADIVNRETGANIFSAETFAGKETPRALGLLREGFIDKIGEKNFSRDTLAQLLGDVVEREALTTEQLAKRVMDVVVDRVQRDLKIANPAWTNDITRYLTAIEYFERTPAAKEAILAAGIDKKYIEKGGKIYSNIEKNQKAGILFEGGGHRAAKQAAKEALDVMERFWKQVERTVPEGERPRTPNTLDPALRGNNINRLLDFAYTLKEWSAPFDLALRPGFQTLNFFGDSIMAGLRGNTAYFRNLFGARGEKIRAALNTPHDPYLGAKSGFVPEALGIHQSNELLPAQRGAFREFIYDTMPGGRVLQGTQRVLSSAGEGVQNFLTKIPGIGNALNESYRRTALYTARVEALARTNFVAKATEDLMRTRGYGQEEAFAWANKEWNEWIAGRPIENWAGVVDWSGVHPAIRDAIVDAASKTDRTMFEPVLDSVLAAQIDPIIQIMDNAPSTATTNLLGRMQPQPLRRPPAAFRTIPPADIMEKYNAHAALTAPTVKEIQTRQVAVNEAMGKLPIEFRSNTDGMVRVMEELVANPASTPKQIYAAWSGPGGPPAPRIGPAEIAALQDLRTRIRDYFSAVADGMAHSEQVWKSMGVDPITSKLPPTEMLRVLDNIPDPFNPGWKDAAGNPTLERGILQPDGTYKDSAGNPVTFTNSMVWAAQGIPPGGNVFRDMKARYREQVLRAISDAESIGLNMPGKAGPREKALREVQGLKGLDDSKRTLYRDAAVAEAHRGAMQDTRATLLGYDDRTAGQFLLDHVTPYSYWTMNHMADVGAWFASHPTQYYVFMTMMRDWAEATQDLPESQKFSAFLWKTPDGGEVRLRPASFFAFMGSGLAEAIDPYNERPTPWQQAIVSGMNILGVRPNRVIDYSLQAATTAGAGPWTEWYTGPKEGRGQTLTTQGAMVNRILKSQGIDFDLTAPIRSAIYGQTRNGLDDYYTGLELARRVKDKEITNNDARRAILSVRDNTPNDVWKSAEKAAMGERSRAYLTSYLGIPVNVLTPERMRIEDLAKDYYGKSGPDGKTVIQPREDLRTTDARQKFRRDNPDLAIKEALNDDRLQLVKSIAMDDFSAAYTEMQARQRAAQEALDARAAKGEISGAEWRKLGKELDQKFSDEYKALDKQYAYRNLHGPFKPVGGGFGTARDKYIPEDAAQVEELRKAVQGYRDIKYNEENPSAFYEARTKYIEKLPETLREKVLSELTKNETAGERFERTIIAPLEDKLRAVPKYINVSDAQYARYEKLEGVYNAARNGATPKEGYAAMVKAGLAKTEAEAQRLYGEMSKTKNPEREKLRNSDEFLAYRDFYRIPKTEERPPRSTGTGAGTRTGTGIALPDGTPTNANEFLAKSKELRDAGRPQEAYYQLALNWDALKAAGVNLRGEKPNIQQAQIKSSREALYAQMPPKGSARDEWLAQGNGRRLNEMNAQLGEKAIWPELDMRQLAAKRDNDAFWASYNALPSGDRSRYLQANRGRLDANNEILKGTSYESKTPTTSTSSGGAPRGGGGGGGGGGGDAKKAPTLDDQAIKHLEGKNASIALGASLEGVKAWYKGQAVLDDALLSTLRKLRTLYPFGMPYAAPETEWLRALVERLQLANPN